MTTVPKYWFVMMMMKEWTFVELMISQDVHFYFLVLPAVVVAMTGSWSKMNYLQMPTCVFFVAAGSL